jgi:hypothetical protein
MAIKVYFLLTAIRIGLWLVPFTTLRSFLNKVARRSINSRMRPITPEKIAWIVQKVSRYVPPATCLTQALTVQVLLAQEGIHSDLEIGVARDDELGLKAHAWLEIDGTVIIGGQDRDHYTRLIRQE